MRHKTQNKSTNHIMEVETMITRTITPSSPTPDHRKSFTLSIFDQLSPPIYVPLILFYTNTGDFSGHEASLRLKKSLSLTLTSFFPLAAGGSKIRDNTGVDCADEGVSYREARVSCRLRDILAPPDLAALGRLLPAASGFGSESEGSGGLLVVQESVFECGGIAIGICFSHKIGDAATISCFLKSWADICARGGDAAADPDFSLGELFPALDAFAWSSHPSEQALPAADKCASRRFVLSPTKLAALRAKSSSTSVPNPTRVEAVSSLIWQCAMRASSANSSAESSYGLLQTVNLRKRIDPPLPDTTFGNFVGFYVSTANNEDPKDLASLVTKIGVAKEEYMQSYPTKLLGPEGVSLICATVQQGAEFGKDGFTLYWLTSWCKFGLYEADFGWGKPIWTGIYQLQCKNCVVLMDGSDGEGIEAWLSLPEDVMDVFEQDQEFLSFASPNPNVVATDLG